MPAASNAFPADRPVVAVDIVLLTVRDGGLKVLVMDRADGAGWALPGVFVRIGESLDEAVRRVLAGKARAPSAFVEQLYTFGAPERDPRSRVITISYYGLIPVAELDRALSGAADLTLAGIEVPWTGETGGPVTLCDVDGSALSTAFDHAEIVGVAVKRLRGKLDYTAVGLELLPDLFPLRDLQAVHEAILGVSLTKPAFRRRMLDKGFLEATGLREPPSPFRPAELYRRARPVTPAFEENAHG